jgi:hypothetical protein
MRIITTAAMGAIALGLLGCSWGDAQFEWPWNRQTVPVTHATWTSPKDWPEPATQPREEPGKTDRKIATTQQAASRPATGLDEPLQIGETREITTAVLPIKDKFITVQEILHEAKDKLSAIESDDRFERRVRVAINRAIARRINSELVFSEAEARLTKAQKEHVDAQVDDIERGMIADAGGSRTRLEKLLAQDDLTIKDVREDRRRRMTVHLYQRIKFLPAISITRPMLLGYYNQHKDDFRVEKKVGMQLIGVLCDKFLPPGIGSKPTGQELAKAKAAAKEVIRQAAKLLNDGEDFTEVSKKLSHVMPKTGGRLPVWPAGSLLQTDVEKAAFALKKGQMSGIVETFVLKDKEGRTVNNGGFYIVRAYEVQEGRVTSFEEAQEKISEILRTEQLKRLTDKFSDRLYNESRIPQSPDFVETTVREAIKLYWKP